jgi:hypothetical protein
VVNRALIQSPAEFQGVHTWDAKDGIHTIGFKQFDTGFAHVHFGIAIRVHV